MNTTPFSTPRKDILAAMKHLDELGVPVETGIAPRVFWAIRDRILFTIWSVTGSRETAIECARICGWTP